MNILLVDDDSDDQSIFCDAIRSISTKVQCVTAQNGKEALTWLEKAKTLPDIIFLDINMPVMDGRETLKALKASDRFKEIPVTMYSTSANPKEIEKFKSMGAEYLTKPNEFNALILNITEVLKKIAAGSRVMNLNNR
jgi:CheY-like chemotaxis protein